MLAHRVAGRPAVSAGTPTDGDLIHADHRSPRLRVLDRGVLRGAHAASGHRSSSAGCIMLYVSSDVDVMVIGLWAGLASFGYRPRVFLSTSHAGADPDIT